MPTHLPPEIQQTLAGFWCYAQEDMTAEVLAHLMDESLPPQTVRDWTELVRYIPKSMLRPSEPPAAYWHGRLAEHCRTHLNTCSYARSALVHHLLHSHPQAAAEQLDDFDFLFARLQLSPRQAGLIWREILSLPPELRPSEWEDFWRGRQFLIDPPDERNPRPHLIFLALAEAYAANSRISRMAQQWLSQIGPAESWLRQRFRPETPFEYPLLLQLPEEDLPAREFNHVWVSRLLFNPEGNRLLTVTSQGRARLWEVDSGRPLAGLDLPLANFEWSESGLMAVSGWNFFRLDDELNIVEQQHLQGEHPWGRSLSLGGERLVTTNKRNQVLVWDWKQGRQLCLLSGPERGLQDVRLSRDGRRVVMISQDGEAQGWQLDEAGLPVRHHRHTRRPWSDIGPQCESVWEWCGHGDWAFSWENGTWRCFNRAEDQLVAQWGCPPPDEKITRDGRERYVLAGSKTVLGRSECVQLDGRRRRALTWKHGSSSAEVVDLVADEVLTTLNGHRDALVAGCLCGDGGRAATVTKQGNLRVWDTGNGKCLRQLKGKASCVALNEDGSLALSGDKEGQVRLWNVSRGHCMSILEGHREPVEWLAFGAEDSFISGDSEQFLIWGPDRRIHARIPRPPRLYAREISPCGRYLYAEKVGNDRWGQPLVFDLDEARVVHLLPCPPSKPASACFAEDGRSLVVANQEGEFFQSVSLRRWGLDEKIRQLDSFRLPLPFNTLGLSPTMLAGSCKGNQVRLWRLNSNSPPGHEGAVLSLSREGDRLLSGGIDKRARLWDLESGGCLTCLSGDERWVQQVLLRWPYAWLGQEQQAWLYDLESGRREPGHLIPQRVSAQAEALSMEKDRLLYWNPRALGKAPARLGPHRPEVCACDFSPDGLRAVSLNAAGTLKLWDLSSLRCLKSWTTGLGGVTSVSWVEGELLCLEGGGQRWSWDLEHGTGTRLALEGSAPRQLDFGSSWSGKPLKVDGLAIWWGRVQQALDCGRGRIVAALETGELLFLELVPAGPHQPGQALARPATTPIQRRARQSRMNTSGLERLQPCQRVLLLASGGRSDLLAALPLALDLKARGKEIFLAAPLSGKKPSERYREIPPKGKAFENRLAALIEVPLYGFHPEGTLPRLELLRDLALDLSIDGLLLVEAGVETLLRGDEPSLGSAADDLVSLAAARQLELPVKLLANLGFGYDLNKGLSHAYTLEAIAELSQDGGFYGSLSLLPGTPEFALLVKGAALLASGHPIHSLIQALQGEFGGSGYLNPLANQYWFFDLDQVASRCRVLDWLQEKITAMDVHRSLTNFLTVNPPRPWLEITC
ncbi:MAG: DUF1152 domain-containing protein [Vulcanimicrobiota bacterium]